MRDCISLETAYNLRSFVFISSFISYDGEEDAQTNKHLELKSLQFANMLPIFTML